MRYRLAIFDMDGTILDTLSDLADSVNATLAAKGMPTHSIDAVRRFVGNGAAKLIERAVPAGTSPAEIEQTLQDFTTYYKAHSAVKTAP